MTTVTMPGKAILFGEHAVVYPGNTAIILPIHGASCAVTVSPNLEPGITPRRLLEYLAKAKADYTAYQQTADSNLLHTYQQPANYPHLVMALTAGFLHHRGINLQPLRVRIKSSLPIGGMGSSAAVAAGIIQAYARHHGLTPTRDEWYELALSAEHFQHGRSSGADIAAVTWRQPVRLSRDQAGATTITALHESAIPTELLRHCYVVHTGRPRQSTAEMVAHVRASHHQNPTLIQAIEANTQAFLNQTPDTLTEQQFIEYINTNGRLLEQLGVATSISQDISRQIRERGGAAKVSGAGALGEGAGGALVIYLADRALLHELSARYEVYHA